jgi:hypothetical protein
VRSRLRPFVLALLGMAALAGRCWAAPEEPLTWEGTYAVSMVWADGKPVRMGTETRRYFPAQYEGQTVQAFESKSEIRLQLQGAAVEISQTALAYSSLEHDPLYLESSMAGGAGTQRIVARFTPGRVKYERTLGTDAPTKGEVDVPDGVSLRDPDVMWDPKTTPAGTSVTAWGFRPEVLRIAKVTITCAGEEQLEVAGKSVTAFRVEADDELTGPSTTWADDDGMVLKQLFAVQGMQFITELTDGAQAADGGPDAGGPVPDLLVGSLVDCGGEIPAPRSCRELKIMVSGVDRDRMFLSGERQTYGPIEKLGDGTMQSELTVKTEVLPVSGPALGGVIPDDVRAYLKPSETIQSADPAFTAKAAEIVGAETDSWKAAMLIGDWVTENVTPSLSEGLLRSAKEVLANPRGECRSYSAIYCALARAAGIPCRMVAGAVYLGPALGETGRSRFGFHAWDEVWVGRWVAVDTAFPGPQGFVPVDATHLKFAEGDVADVSAAARIVRSLKLKLIESDTQKSEAKPVALLRGWWVHANGEMPRCAQAS